MPSTLKMFPALLMGALMLPSAAQALNPAENLVLDAYEEAERGSGSRLSNVYSGGINSTLTNVGGNIGGSVLNKYGFNGLRFNGCGSSSPVISNQNLLSNTGDMLGRVAGGFDWGSVSNKPARGGGYLTSNDYTPSSDGNGNVLSASDLAQTYRNLQTVDGEWRIDGQGYVYRRGIAQRQGRLTLQNGYSTSTRLSCDGSFRSEDNYIVEADITGLRVTCKGRTTLKPWR